MKFEKVNSKTNLIIVIDQIKDQITGGLVMPGEKLPPERELAKMMGVSRTTIREAIKALSYAGYFDVYQGKGVFVKKSALKYDDVLSFFISISDYSIPYLLEVRLVFEGEAARLAAKRSNKKNIEKIKKCYKSMEEASTIEEFVIKDLQFHLAIVEATQNPLMYTLMEIIGAILHEETNSIIEFTQNIQNRMLDNSNEVLQAIKRSDEENAKNLMLEHLKILSNSACKE